MWYAEKIELTKNIDDGSSHTLYLNDCFTLKINGEFIHNAVTETLSDWFETCICTECGQEGCNGAPMIQIRKQGDKLLFLPDFDCMETFEEYNWKTNEGERSGPPHKWYEEGILIVEGEALEKLHTLLPEFRNQKINDVSEKELEKIKEWEECVRVKPKGFISEYPN